MTRERRSLWGSISTSKKVNKLSLKASLLYTWAIPHFDDYGYQEADPKVIKHAVIPFRDDIPLEEIKQLILEIVSRGLWKLFHKNSTVFIKDPVWEQRQSFHGIHRLQSNIAELLKDCPETKISITDTGEVVVQQGADTVHKRSKEKLSEVKGSEVKGKGDQPLFLSEKEKEQKKREQKEIERKFASFKEKEMRE